MQPTHFDIAIIGGGLAGLSLAIQAASAGWQTVLFEKEEYPFHKVCGEYISNESRSFLQKLGVDLKDLPNINSLNISDAKGKLYKFNLPLGGFGISRYKLDDELYKIAKSKGVTIFTNTKVNDICYSNDGFIVDSNEGKFAATLAAAAFGKRSNMDVKWKRSFTTHKNNKLNNYIGVKYHVEYPLLKNVIALHNFSNGYCGISNIEDDKCCLCYLTTSQNLKRNNNSIPLMEKNVLSQNPHLQRIFADGNFLFDAPVTISQISFEAKLQVEDHVLMMGDAAGMITPLCGNGMSMALHASKLAFEYMHQFLNKEISRDKMEVGYVKKWNAHFSSRLKTGRFVQQLFGGERSTSLFLKTMNAMPFIARQIIKTTHGKGF